jgi:hypothetical protein
MPGATDLDGAAAAVIDLDVDVEQWGYLRPRLLLPVYTDGKYSELFVLSAAPATIATDRNAHWAGHLTHEHRLQSHEVTHDAARNSPARARCSRRYEVGGNYST